MKTFEKYLGEAFRPLSPKKHWPGEYKAPPKENRFMEPRAQQQNDHHQVDFLQG